VSPAAILVALAALAPFHEDREAPGLAAHRAEVSQAVALVARTPDEAAFLLSWGWHESKFAIRIGLGKCERYECDPHRRKDGTIEHWARGFWQVHRNGLKRETWARMEGPGTACDQAKEAARMVRWALRACPADRIRGAFRVMYGAGCQRPLKGEAERVATFYTVRKRL
jgi:hypothetical protein